MNTFRSFLLISLASLTLTGCAVSSKDIKQANNYQMGLASHLGIAPEQVTVTPGAGVAHVTITGVPSAIGSRTHRRRPRYAEQKITRSWTR